MAISPISSGVSPVSTPATSAPLQLGQGVADSFLNMLGEVNQQQVDADNALQDLVSGKTDSVQDVVLTMAKADLSFRMVLEIRNQVLDAYKEIQRMQF